MPDDTAPVSARSTLFTYEVTATHPDYDGPFVLEFVASSERSAISRTRGTAFHYYRDARWLDEGAQFVITGTKPGVWPDGHE